MQNDFSWSHGKSNLGLLAGQIRVVLITSRTEVNTVVYVERVVLGKTLAEQKGNPVYSVSMCSFSPPLPVPTVLPCLLYLQVSEICPLQCICAVEVLAVSASCCQRIKSMIYIYTHTLIIQ